MADEHLDKYLEDIGIDVDGEDISAMPDDDDEFDEPIQAHVQPIALEGDTKERAEAFLVNFLLNFDPAYAVEINRVQDNRIYADIFGGDPGKIIGRNGKTLQALEYLTNAVLNRTDEDNVRVVIDVGGYKRRRDDRLKIIARKAASKVRATGKEYVLKPMSASERRVVHMELADDPSVKSESSGEGRNRKVVVKPNR
ncbi:MAG: KH domain-containing protein [Trueperaceae bacterium]|nr:KH domain-containing protein [Trueperaceae bacterium]